MLTSEAVRTKVEEVLRGSNRFELFLGDCRAILDYFPTESVDCVITSPPYWQMREYEVDEVLAESVIGSEENPEGYVNNILEVFRKIMRILRPHGSVWLNIGDRFWNKNLMGMPWRVALALQGDGWILRNDVIWEKMKGTQSAKDRLRTIYEHVFHFVKNRDYYYDYASILIKPRKVPSLQKGAIASATGVTGKKYRKQILESPHLTDRERQAALEALEDVLRRMKEGELVDFRMTIRGNQRTLHSDNGLISGRARELEQKGFFILTSHAEGYMPPDIWRIVPEDKWRKDAHYAVFPVELLEIPIKATCPRDGVVLDPFIGIGSTIVAALRFGRRGLGIDISDRYIGIARRRLKTQQQTIVSFMQ